MYQPGDGIMDLAVFLYAGQKKIPDHYYMIQGALNDGVYAIGQIACG